MTSCWLKHPLKNMPQNLIISPQQYKISISNLFDKGYSENEANFMGKSRRKSHMLFVSCLHSDGWLTTEGENGQARPLLYRNFLFQ